jgi:hypothetical protein
MDEIVPFRMQNIINEQYNYLQKCSSLHQVMLITKDSTIMPTLYMKNGRYKLNKECTRWRGWVTTEVSVNWIVKSNLIIFQIGDTSQNVLLHGGVLHPFLLRIEKHNVSSYSD